MKYRITDTNTGQEMGTFEATDKHHALDLLAQDAGYKDHESVMLATGGIEQDIHVEEVGDPDTCECDGLGFAIMNTNEIQRCDLCKIYPDDAAAADAAAQRLARYPKLLKAAKAAQDYLHPGGGGLTHPGPLLNEALDPRQPYTGAMQLTVPGRLDDLIEILVSVSDTFGPECQVHIGEPAGDSNQVTSVQTVCDDDEWTVYIHADH